MRKFFLLTITLVSIVILKTNAQTDDAALQEKFDAASFGLGIGLDYGGIGTKLQYYPTNNFGLFGGVGYAFAGVGYNAGIKYRFNSTSDFKKFTPYLTAMYGYNAAIKVSNSNTNLDKFFYGVTLGIGGDLKGWPEKKGYWSFALLIPIRDPEVSEYMDYLEQNYGVSFDMGLLPIGISVGYHFIIGWK